MITESKEDNYYEGKLGKALIGLTINNKTVLESSKWKNVATITFDHQTYSVKLLFIFKNLVLSPYYDCFRTNRLAFLSPELLLVCSGILQLVLGLHMDVRLGYLQKKYEEKKLILIIKNCLFSLTMFLLLWIKQFVFVII